MAIFNSYVSLPEGIYKPQRLLNTIEHYWALLIQTYANKP